MLKKIVLIIFISISTFNCVSTFSSRNPADVDIFQTEFEETVSKLDGEDSTIHLNEELKRSLAIYSSNMFPMTNRNLRKENLVDDSSFMYSICRIDAAIKVAHIQTKNLILFRGHNYLPSDNAKQPGYIFSDRAYLSTSLSLEVAKKFAKLSGNPKVIDIIEFEEQQIPGIWLDPISFYGRKSVLENEREYEVLLARNLKFKLVKTKQKYDYFYRFFIFDGFIDKSIKETIDCSTLL